MIKGLKHLTYEETLREMGLLSLEKTGIHTNLYEYLIGEHKRVGDKLHLVMPNEGQEAKDTNGNTENSV